MTCATQLVDERLPGGLIIGKAEPLLLLEGNGINDS